MPWQTTRFDLDLSRPLVMGIVNATPDSFSDGGRYDDAKAAIAHAERLVKAGADILDVGGNPPGLAPKWCQRHKSCLGWCLCCKSCSAGKCRSRLTLTSQK